MKTTIRGKLTMLMTGLCAIILALVWFLTLTLFEPTYYRMIDEQLDAMVATIEPILSGADIENEMDLGVLERLKKDGICLDIYSDIVIDENPLGYVYYEGVGDSCAIHHEGTINYFGEEPVNVNTETAISLRARAREEGSFSLVMNNTVGGQQYVVGRYIESCNMTVIVSTNLERVEQAFAVFRQQLFMVTLIIMGVSLIMAATASEWVTKPITKLSEATKSIAEGNYEVSVPVYSKDELGNLAQEFNAMTKEVSKADKLQKELVANFSHDLRTPLTLIRGYAEAVRDLTGNDEALRSEQMDIIIDETDRLTNLISSAMEFSRYSSDVMKIKLGKFDVNEMMQDMATRYNRFYEKAGYKMKTDTCENGDVYADAEMISRVMDNLLLNAISHIGEDRQVIIRTQETDEGVKVTVEDHGEGISEEELPYLFDRYYRTRSSEGTRGTGLGLSIVKAILSAHQFPFGVESEEGKGTAFWFVMKTEA